MLPRLRMPVRSRGRRDDAQLSKRLIEVDLPIKRISAHARREKSIRHGHISTLHIWWARRPLAACRAVICASLGQTPSIRSARRAFATRRRRSSLILPGLLWRAKNSAGAAIRNLDQVAGVGKDRGTRQQNEGHWNILRFALLDFIADFANWDNSTVKEYLDASRALTQAAHEALGRARNTPDGRGPFAGGGSIPLEALRVALMPSPAT